MGKTSFKLSRYFWSNTEVDRIGSIHAQRFETFALALDDAKKSKQYADRNQFIRIYREDFVLVGGIELTTTQKIVEYEE
ncbi:MAG: hypothetical protein KGL39_42150 [Patescibacteria group bacterium]|nr:hypothetical protein [Patescibacteria group bacterium]